LRAILRLINWDPGGSVDVVQPSAPVAIGVAALRPNRDGPTNRCQNLTAHVLRKKGVPEAAIGAAINNPAQMRNLLNQLCGRRSMVASDAGGGFGGQIGADTSDDQPGPAPTPSEATPDSYPPFGWAGLPALRR
jgi:hypothetical protein